MSIAARQPFGSILGQPAERDPLAPAPFARSSCRDGSETDGLDPLDRIHRQGWEAGFSMRIPAHPFAEGSEAARAWMAGYVSGQQMAAF